MNTLTAGGLGVSISRRPKFLAFTIAAAASLIASASSADPVVWTLNNVEVLDGSTVSGSFTYDADIDVYSAINITTTSSGRGPFRAEAFTANGPTMFIAHQSPAQTNQNGVFLATAVPKTNAGGTLTLRTESNFGGFTTCLNDDCTSATTVNGADSLTSGTIVGVPAAAPVPTLSEWAMILLGVIMAGGAALYIQRRRLVV